MKRARVVVLAIAFTAALGAAWVAKKIVGGPREVETVEKTVGATDVLVAATNINLGDSVNAQDLKWQQWPVEGITPGLITRDAQPDAPTKLSGAVARAPFIAGEPIKEQKLIKISEGGVMAAILPAGMRAISTPIREETAAGGFILPNDRVDVILSHKHARRLQGGAGERGGAAQCPRARHRPGNRNQGRRQGRDRQDRDIRAYPAAGRDAGSGAVDGRDLALLAQPRRLDPRSRRDRPPRSASNSSSVKILKYGVSVARLRRQLRSRRRPDKEKGKRMRRFSLKSQAVLAVFAAWLALLGIVRAVAGIG